MTENTAETVAQALQLIQKTPGYSTIAEDLQRRFIRYLPSFPDRGTVTWRGEIVLGPEPFAGSVNQSRVSVAGTLMHEAWHLRQNPFLKTVSFWAGTATCEHPMRRYEWPAYRQQAEFLTALALARPELRTIALHEREAVLASFQIIYGDIQKDRI